MPDSVNRSIETHLRAAVESAPSGLLMADASGRIVLVNREIERLFGYAREELLGQPIERLVPERFRRHHPDYRAMFREDPRVRAMGAGRDLFGLRKDGAEVPVEIGLTPVPTEDGMFVLGAIVDISARKQHEAEQRELNERLRQAQKMEAVGTLAGGIAHDFNNLLGAIVGYTELIINNSHDAQSVTRDAGALLGAALRGRSLVQQILTFSRRREHTRKPLALGEVIGEIQQLLRATLPASIELKVRIAPGLPSVLADGTAVHQVLMNLSTNSAQAMVAGGRLEISAAPLYVRDSVARANPSLREGPYVSLEVRDTGPGMSTDTIGRAFEPFFTTKPQGEGTGLGLAMVHGIMREHDGSVQIESDEGVGTMVRCLFPVLEPDAVETAQPGQTPATVGRGERILLVDDEPSLLSVGGRRLTGMGFVVETAEGPAEAMRLLEDPQHQFDLMITDFSMPGMSGVELAAKVSTLRPGLPVILLTGFIDELQESDLRAVGIRQVLHKPILGAELAAGCVAVLRGGAV